MSLSAFVQRVGHGLNRFAHHVHKTYHSVKSHARRALPVVKEIARRVRDAAQNYSTLPVVGTVASQIGQVAGAVHTGADWGQRILHASDRFDSALKSDISLRGHS